MVNGGTLMPITVVTVHEKLNTLIEDELDYKVIVLEEDETKRKTVAVQTFVELFGEADFTYESLTQEKYENYRYKPFFDLWKEQGLLE